VNAQQLHRLGLPAAQAQAPQGPRGLHDVALVPMGAISTCALLRAPTHRLLARRELRSAQPAPQKAAAADVLGAQQVGRSLTDETRPAPLGD